MESGYRVEIDQVNKSEWSSFLSYFADGTIYQTWSYGAVRWGEKNLSHLVLRRDEKIVGMAQLAIKRVPILHAGIAYVPWGPIWRVKGQDNDLEKFRKLIRALKEEYAKRRRLMVRITPCEIASESEEIISLLVEEEFENTGKSYRTFLLDLTPPLEKIRKSLDQKWRNQLNRSEKNDLKIVVGTTDELYSQFIALYNDLLERKGFETFVDVNEFRTIQKDLDESLKMKIMLCDAEGKPVAALVGSAMGYRGIYLLGASNDNGMKTKGSYLLQWKMIQWLKENKYRWYDLGGIDTKKNPGVYHFKAGLSGKEISHVGQFEYSCNQISSMVVKLGEFLNAQKRG